MPVRSLRSSVLRWPDQSVVDPAVRSWASEIAALRPDVARIGYFGSYARGDWGVGSDLDVLIVVKQAEDPFERRAAAWDLTKLPVPADAFVYTEREWESIRSQPGFGRTVSREVVWVYGDERAGREQGP